MGKSKNEIDTRNYKMLYENIMKTDQNIRFATIFDLNGNIICGGQRKGVKNILDPQESKKSLQQTANAWKSRKELLDKLGKGKYILAHYENVKRITIPLDEEHLLYITTEEDADHVNIINKSLNLKAAH